MRFTIQLPDPIIKALQAQAKEAHRPPKHHAEYLLMQAIRAQDDLTTPAAARPAESAGAQRRDAKREGGGLMETARPQVRLQPTVEATRSWRELWRRLLRPPDGESDGKRAAPGQDEAADE